MKTKSIYLLLLIAVWALSGCEDKLYESYLANSPVYMSYDELRSAVKQEAARAVVNPGKIYFKDNYIFINEQMAGVHVFDVSNPASPEELAFLNIPGNVDIAIKEDVLYADSYVDLVAIDVSDLNNMHEVGRVKDVFPYIIPEYDLNYRVDAVDQDLGVVTGWEIKEVRHQVERLDYPIYYYDTYADYLSGSEGSISSGGVGGSNGSSFGVGGSMARFGLNGNFLYTVDNYMLYTFNISNLESPVNMGGQYAGWGIETMFQYNNHLFLGTTSGMLVYSLALPERPNYLSQYSHMTACDPVVIQDNLAYITLRDGGWCGRSVNQLDVVEMSSDYTSFTELANYPMYSPRGLGIDGDILFICDGEAGLKVFDASDPLAITDHLLSVFSSIQVEDVIPVSNYLFAVGAEGFYLYDYSDLQNIHLLAQISVEATD